MRALLIALLLSSCDSKDGDTASATDDSSPVGDDSASVDGDDDGVDAANDCNDDDASIHPGADEIIADAIDQDCDGNDLCYTDADGDGFGSAKTVAAPTCKDKGVASTSTDCGDGDATVYPGAKELVADGIDQDCDDGDVCFVDADGDGFGSPLTLTGSDVDCADAGESDAADDCLDVGKDAFETFPGSAELDSETDCMTDVDGDGYGDSTPSKGVTAGTDCNDAGGECAEFHIGNDVEFSTASSHSPNYLLGPAITVPSDMTLTALALIGKSATANVRMALYTDDAGNPDALIVETASTAVPVGVLEISVTPTPLPAGTYWIMAVYDTTASIGLEITSTKDVSLYQSMSFSSAMPDPFGTASVNLYQIFNYYIVGY